MASGLLRNKDGSAAALLGSGVQAERCPAIALPCALQGRSTVKCCSSLSALCGELAAGSVEQSEDLLLSGARSSNVPNFQNRKLEKTKDGIRELAEMATCALNGSKFTGLQSDL